MGRKVGVGGDLSMDGVCKTAATSQWGWVRRRTNSAALAGYRHSSRLMMSSAQLYLSLRLLRSPGYASVSNQARLAGHLGRNSLSTIL